jgi:hypothetical protein
MKILSLFIAATTMLFGAAAADSEEPIVVGSR